MKILLTNWRISWFSGSDTFTHTLGKELKRRGHEVDVFGRKIGLHSFKFQEDGINVKTTLTGGFSFSDEYDVIHCHHVSMARKVDMVYPKIPKVFVCHGILPEEEKPPRGVGNIRKFIAVSEETKEMLESQYKKNNVEIVRNFVDVNRFKMKDKFFDGKRKLRILILSNYYGFNWEGKEIDEAQKVLGFEKRIIGGNGLLRSDISDDLRWADIVISLGRGIVEAMSCGTAVIVGDYNGFDGAIFNKKQYEEIRKHNFSGRRFKMKFTGEQLVDEINSILKHGFKSTGKFLRKTVLENHNSKIETKKLEKIYEDAKNYRTY